MGIRTVEQYKQSLKDERRVYIRGEKVNDVTTHPILGVSVDTMTIWSIILEVRPSLAPRTG